LRIAVEESYLQGVSTRKIQEVVSKFGLENISSSEVSRIAKDPDEKVKEFLERLIEGEIDYLFLDALEEQSADFVPDDFRDRNSL
jgi:putative transposase